MVDASGEVTSEQLPREGVVRRVLDPRSGLQALIDALRDSGYRVHGPTVRDGVIVNSELQSETQLPSGCTVEQGPGQWRLEQGDGPGRFTWTPGADSWKPLVFPPRSELLRIRRVDGTWVTTVPGEPVEPPALIGVRDCELRALGVIDRVFLDPVHPDPRYADRRVDAFVVAVTCGRPSATCWCTSIGGSPEPQQGFDIRITELLDDESAGGHRLLAESGSARGASVLASLPGRPATDGDREAAALVVERSVDAMPRRLPGEDLPELLAGVEHHPRWEAVAARCVSCGNCTMVCPTCTCSSFSDETTLDGTESVRVQEWASCFQLDHSNLGGRPVRATTADRYRQWLLHKLQSWSAQMGTTGCVGCGRCTTWCPVGIDIVEEAAALLVDAPSARAVPEAR